VAPRDPADPWTPNLAVWCLLQIHALRLLPGSPPGLPARTRPSLDSPSPMGCVRLVGAQKVVAGLGHGASGTESARQVLGPEFKPRYCQKKKGEKI
jgi:hypothetical protein